MTTTIVVPLVGPRLDPERVSEQSLPAARALVRQTGSNVLLVSVIDLYLELGGLPESKLLQPETIRQRVAERSRYLDALATTFQGCTVRCAVRIGNPVDALHAATDHVKRPVFVMTSHWRRGIRRLTLGSVTWGCVQRARGPVLVVPVQPGVDATPDVAFDRLMVPVDGTPFAEYALHAALELVGTPETTVQLVSVIEPPGWFTDRSSAEFETAARHIAERYLADLTERLRLAGYTSTSDIRYGDPEREITTAADECSSGVIAMSTRGRTGIGRLLSGSVAEGVGKLVDRPLLLVRPSLEMVEEHLRRTRAGSLPPSPMTSRGEGTRTILAADIMTAPAITIRDDQTLEAAAMLMLERGIGCLPVIDGEGLLTGMLTESDFTGRERCLPFSAFQEPALFGKLVSSEGIERIHAAARSMTVRQVMHAPVITTLEHEPVTHVVERMIGCGINRVPVVRDGRPVGIVARHDLLKILVCPVSVASDEGGTR